MKSKIAYTLLFLFGFLLLGEDGFDLLPDGIGLPGLAARALDFADDVLERRLAPPADDDMRALRGEQLGGLAADAAATAGDDRHLPVEPADHTIL